MAVSYTHLDVYKRQLIDRTVAERDRTAHVVSILYNLFHPSFDADGSFLRFTGRLPESDAVEQIVHITVKPLLTLHRAPHRYPLFYKPCLLYTSPIGRARG